MRLVTWNIHKGIGGADRRYDFGRILAVLDHLRPDLVCLQEVAVDLPAAHRHDQPRLLADYFPGFHAFFHQTVHWKKGGYGNLVLSRWPILEKHRISLQYNGRKMRAAQLAQVDAPGGPVNLVNWHLGLGEAERRWQVGHFLGHATWHAARHLPSVVAGDFNDWRNALKAQLVPAGFHQGAAPPSHFRSFPAVLPALSIDKVFHTPGLAVRRIHAVRTALTRQASDHLPLEAELARA